MSVDTNNDAKLPGHRHRLYWFVFIVILLFVTVAGLEIGARVLIALQGQHRFNERLNVIGQAIAHTKVACAHISLIDVFDATEGPIYVDGCCHVNLRGNQLIAEEIIKRLRAEIAHPHAQMLQ